MLRARIVIACLIAAVPGTVGASGHGPVFGGAPPTLGKGGWQLDQAWMGRLGQGRSDDEQMLRTMLSAKERANAKPHALGGSRAHPVLAFSPS
jgi:hypothetical protein